METRYISLDDAVQCANDLAEDFAGEGLDSASYGAQAVAEWLKDIPAAAVVEKTEWDKLMFLVDAANQILEAAKWISVKERLPEPRFSMEWYLVALESGCVMTLAFERAENRWARTGSPVTHWMPLPEPPNEGATSNG